MEDHEDTRHAMERLLTRWGCAVCSAGNVSEALEAVSHGEFDLLLSDMGLPDGTGGDLLKQIRPQHPMHAVAMSGYGAGSDIAATRAAGFEAFLVKPVQMDMLRQIIERIRNE
ncbi:MAG TPA: response regulator [Chthoniobacteraceae bacterium]|nr:response regulator [Chthoniobacteraceae bacterium]